MLERFSLRCGGLEYTRLVTQFRSRGYSSRPKYECQQQRYQSASPSGLPLSDKLLGGRPFHGPRGYDEIMEGMLTTGRTSDSVDH